MNIKNSLKTSVLVYAVVFGINNNVNATITEHNVNSKVFQHNVTITNHNIRYRYYMPERKIYIRNYNTEHLEEMHMQYSDEQYQSCADDHDEFNYPEYNCAVYGYNINDNQIDINIDTKNKFNELYKRKITSGVFGDTITSFENAVRKVFGSDYKVITNISDILLQYPENRIHATKQDNTQKNFININTRNHVIYNANQVYNTLANNNMQLVTKYIDYQWNACDILFSIFHTHTLIITNGKNIICYSNFNHEIRVYQKLDYFKRKDNYIKAVIEKFNKVGLVLREKYEAENRAVKEVFGHDFELIYNK